MDIKFNTGNFTLVISGELNTDSEAKILEQGVRYAVQRDVATKVYLALAGIKNSKGNLTLPDGFERDSISFGEDSAAQMQSAATAELGKLGDFSVEVTENVGGETSSPMKRATELVDSFLGTDKEESFRAILGDGDRDSLIKAANDMGFGKSSPRKAKAA